MTNNTLDVNVRLGCGTLPGSCFAIDPFLCYATRTTVGTAAFVPVNGVDLVTATESRQFDAIRRAALCTPARSLPRPRTRSCHTTRPNRR
ncbi:MAG: hypothetical protein E6J81_00955 [Deltaproteobacteria bacterium]|nr:MAG: hypothetical protein E6J81_00955 [Deltaproteobacteria bacterium]